MAPKQRVGKEVVTGATAPPSPPPVIERPIMGRKIFPFQRFSTLFEVVFWLFHGESPVTYHDQGVYLPYFLIFPES